MKKKLSLLLGIALTTGLLLPVFAAQGAPYLAQTFNPPLREEKSSQKEAWGVWRIYKSISGGITLQAANYIRPPLRKKILAPEKSEFSNFNQTISQQMAAQRSFAASA